MRRTNDTGNPTTMRSNSGTNTTATNTTTNIIHTSSKKRSSTSNNSGGVTGIAVWAMTAVASFWLGTVYSAALGRLSCVDTDQPSNARIIRNGHALLPVLQDQQQHQQRNAAAAGDAMPTADLDWDALCASRAGRANPAAESAATGPLFPPDTVGRYAVAMARASKPEFTEFLDLGVPLDAPGVGSEEILLLYSSDKALPLALRSDNRTNKSSSSSSSSSLLHTSHSHTIESLPLPAALEHCEYLNIVLTDHSRRKQCVAIVPQYESYHIQKWMRINGHGKLDATAPLRMVSRGQQSNGLNRFTPPDLKRDTRKLWTMLQNYFATVDNVMAELEPILKGIVIRNTVIVMVCNFGQSELLVNFVCAAKRNQLDISNIIVFTTDEATTDLAKSLGLAAYFDHRNFGDIPAGAASRYGDAQFVAMMMAKVICVQIVSMMGYDFLFQDVDIVWFKNPLDYFHDKSIPAYKYDVFFQDDGGHSVRYAPYSANSGFYFVRYNARTRHFLTSLLMTGDLILKTDSHQQALIATLNEHVSLYGLKAKVLSRDMEEFPGGFQFHQKSKQYMIQFYEGTVHPYIFHMSWTLNKDNKLLFLRQMGQWYVNDQCIQTKIGDISGANSEDLASTCCSAEPLFSCHYRDKPSLKPCKDFPPIDKGKKSWW